MDSRIACVIDRFGKHRVNGEDSVLICCPIHEETDPSCSVWIDKQQRMAVNCFAGCDAGRLREVIVGHCGDHRDTGQKTWVKKTDADQWLSPLPLEHAPLPSSRQFKIGNEMRTIEAKVRYEYRDKSNRHRGFCVQRWEWLEGDSRKKRTLPYSYYSVKGKPGEHGWAAMVPGGPRLLYGLEQLPDDESYAKPLLVVEGEKCADLARALLPELVVLTWQGGSSTAADAEWDQLVAKFPKVYLWPDNDEPGIKWARALSQLFHERGETVALVEWGRDPGDDIADAHAAGIDIVGLLEQSVSLYENESTVVSRWCAREDWETASCDECAFTRCLQYGRLVEPRDLLNRTHLEREWVYAISQGQFYNVTQEARAGLDPAKYNAACAGGGYTASGKDAASHQFLNDGRGTKVETVTWAPGHPVLTSINGQTAYNTWRPVPTSVGPVEPTIWLELMEHVVPDEAVREHLFNYLAFMVQHPERKINHAPVIISQRQGIGKSSLTVPIVAAMGSQAREIGSESFESSFQDWLVNAKFVVIEELYQTRGRYAISNRIKRYLAAPPDTVTINPKGSPEYHIFNRVQFFAFSKHENALALDNASDDARRWLPYISPAEPLDQGFYKAYYNWVYGERQGSPGPGTWSTWNWLRRRDLSAFDPGEKPIETEAKQLMRRHADPVMAWIDDSVKNEVPPFDVDVVSPELIRQYVQEHLRMRVPWQTQQWSVMLKRIGLQPLNPDSKKNRVYITNRTGKRECHVLYSTRRHIFWAEMLAQGATGMIRKELSGDLTVPARTKAYEEWFKARNVL